MRAARAEYGRALGDDGAVELYSFVLHAEKCLAHYIGVELALNGYLFLSYAGYSRRLDCILDEGIKLLDDDKLLHL